jgi:hypothetical protein
LEFHDHIKPFVFPIHTKSSVALNDAIKCQSADLVPDHKKQFDIQHLILIFLLKRPIIHFCTDQLPFGQKISADFSSFSGMRIFWWRNGQLDAVGIKVWKKIGKKRFLPRNAVTFPSASPIRGRI